MTPTVAKLVLPDDGAGDVGDKRANETMFCVPDKPWEVNAAAGGVGWSGNAWGKTRRSTISPLVPEDA
jgi:hypothetical protein